MKKEIKIIGAGLSGITAAINLALKGFKVEVYEKNPEVGIQIKENTQMLPNWFAKESDIIQELERCSIKIHPVAPIHVIHLFAGGKKINSFKSSKPFGYTVMRGGSNSFEMGLKKEAEKLGVIFHMNWHRKIKADIIATGHKKIDAVVYGRVYEGKFNPTEVYVFIDFEHFQGGYAYLYPHNRKHASLVVGKLANHEINLKESMEKLIGCYKNILDTFNLSLLYDFGGFAGFEIPKTAIKNNSLYVGEAAGFQDPLFGFGMKYAIKSGYFAAVSITEKRNYDGLWKKSFLGEMKKLLLLRDLFYKTKEKTITHLLKSNSSLKNLDVEKIKFLLNSRKINLLLSFYNKLPKLQIFQQTIFYLIIRFSRYFEKK